MSSVNMAILVGRVGQDPEVKYMPNGDALVNLSLATGDQWTDKTTGEKKQDTEWHRLTAFRRLAEIIGEYVKKGSLIYVEGRIKTRKWTDKDGVDRYTTEIVLDQMKLLGPRPDSADDAEPRQNSAARAPVGGSRPAPSGKPAPSSDHHWDDDVPF